MKLDIWSDIACPWCSIGKRRLEAALARFPHASEVQVTWRSFELDPAAPAERAGSYVDRLAEKYGTSPEQAQQMIDRMTATAAADGLDFRFDVARAGNTFDAHRLVHLAARRGKQDPMKERLFRGYLTEGRTISDRETLVELAAEVGLDADEVRRVLASDEFAADVRADERQAAAYGITAVPTFVFDDTYGVSGAQPADVLLQVLEEVWAKTHPPTVLTAVGGGDGAACDGDSCAV